jgi:hypothetical protein
MVKKQGWIALVLIDILIVWLSFFPRICNLTTSITFINLKQDALHFLTVP